MKVTHEDILKMCKTDELRQNLIEAHDKYPRPYRKDKYDSILDYLGFDFYWCDTNQGHYYWSNIFKNTSDYFNDPSTLNEAEQQSEFIEGQEYEFSDDGVSFVKGKYFGFFKGFHFEMDGDCDYPIGYKCIRHIQKTYNFEGEQLTKEEILKRLG